MNDKLLEYIRTNFNVNKLSMLLISNIYDYLYTNSMDCMEEFIEILNDSGIDLTIEEIKENKLIEEV